MRSSLISFTTLLLFMTNCTDSVEEKALIPTLNMEARLLNADEKSQLSQIVLKMQLENYSGDLLKFGISEIEAHQLRLAYYTSQFKKDILLVNGDDTIPCLDSHFERLHMDLPYRNFILTFGQKMGSQNSKLIIDDHQFSNHLVQVKINQ